MATEQTDSGTAYNDLLERANKTEAQILRLEARIKVLEDRAAQEVAKAEAASMGEMLGRMHQEGK